MQCEDKGYLLSKSRYNENSVIAEIFTKNHGKISGIVFGAISKKLKNYLQIGNKFHINFNTKNNIDPAVINEDFISLFNKPGPYYSSYPILAEWKTMAENFDHEKSLREFFYENPNNPVHLYLHIPYCAKLCYYCSCRIHISNNRDIINNFVNVLVKECNMLENFFIKNKIKSCENIRILQDEVVDFCVDNLGICSVKLRSGVTIQTRSLIVCGGTFFNGIIHIGNESYPAGRCGEKPSGVLGF